MNDKTIYFNNPKSLTEIKIEYARILFAFIDFMRPNISSDVYELIF